MYVGVVYSGENDVLWCYYEFVFPREKLCLTTAGIECAMLPHNSSISLAGEEILKKLPLASHAHAF